MAEPFPILVVEDSSDDAELLQRALGRAGVEGPVKFVTDGQHAIDYLEGRDKYGDRNEYPFPKVVISDLKMPRVNGLELLEWLQSHPDCRVIPTVLLSGSALDADIEEAYRLGANTYFQKPGDFTALVELICGLNSYWRQSKLPRAGQKC